MEKLSEKQILQLRLLGYNPSKAEITLEDILSILPSNYDNGICTSVLTLTAPNSTEKLRWVAGYWSFNPRKVRHWFCEADTPLKASYEMLCEFIKRNGIEQLNKI